MTRWRRLPILLTATIGTAASAAVYLMLASSAHQVAVIDFENEARAQVGLIATDLEEATGALDTIRAYLEANQTVPSKEEFVRFSRELHSHSVGLRDTVWAPRVAAADRDSFEKAIRDSGFADFRIFELDKSLQPVRAGDRAEYYPVLYAVSPRTKIPPYGLDLAFEPVRRAAITSAVVTGHVSSMHFISGISTTRPRGALFCFAPVFRGTEGYHNGLSPPAGVVFGVFGIDELMEEIIASKRQLSGVDLYLFDPSEPAGDRMIYWHAGAAGGGGAPSEQALRAMPHWEGEIKMIDQHWGVLALPSGGIESGYRTSSAVLPLIIGLLLTALGVAYLSNSMRRTRELEALTTSLNQTTEGLHEQTARIVRLARYDALTELANRTMFQEALAVAAARAARGEPFALLCLDLDRFKHVNDTLGHPVGDALLRAVAERLRTLVREVDTVARLGGDEFTVVQADISVPDNAATLAQRIIEDLRRPYDLSGHHVVIGVTVGIAFGGPESHDATTLLRNADLALYRAKQEGRGIFRFFEPEMDARAQARRQLELDLRAAIEHSEFELNYQAVVSVADRRIVAFEALARWRHPRRGLVSPNDFIPLAEEIGLIVPIGAWVLRSACAEAVKWPPGVSVAVNLSAAQFARVDIVRQVDAALRESGLDPARLELEITESALLLDSETTLRTLRALRELGVRIAMDDFGTGYGALSYLRGFMFDKLKVDRSFIAALAESDDSANIVSAIAGMGRSLGIATTAEGVETEEQMRQLARDGFTELQGYLFAKPCPGSEIAELLRDEAARRDAAA